MTSIPENNSTVEIRPIGSSQSCISKPDGSAIFTQGDTSVMAAVYGPGDVKPNKALMDKATVTVTYKPKVGIAGILVGDLWETIKEDRKVSNNTHIDPNDRTAWRRDIKEMNCPTPQSVREKALERMIRNTCETVLLTTLFPRSSVDIIVQEIQDAGALLACSINAACLAMINAGIPMKCTVSASCCVMGKEEELIADPTKEQTKDAECILTAAVDSSTHNLITSSIQGSCTVEQYHKLMSVCQKACKKVFEFYREAMERTLSKP